ncbi:hypothetical protein CBR_g16866 [Chara braunii]|uniref:Uncharacterized protein n=1 Tax=Chara braunii TaxID=69332 RepID=A0A388KUA1_CHABU|nr:hypothetical protein CBR_g16866 [Chara braunii]|eukprot:GBG73523.1 hypothetical protein CBR_g16866 [Chara braunii]
MTCTMVVPALFAPGVCDEEIVEIFHSAELIRDFENGAASALEDCCDQSEANNEESGFTDGWMTPTTPVCGMDDCEAHTPHPAVMVPSREPNGDSKVDSETEKQSTTLERSNAKDDAAAAASDAEEKKMQLRSADSSDAKESRPVNEGEAKEGDGDEARSRKAAVMADVDDSKGVDDVNAGRSSADNDVSGIPRCSVCEKEGTDCSHRCQDEEAVRPILDEAMQQLSKCSQGTEDLPIKKVLLSSLLKQRAELTQALDQKTVQVEQMAEVVHAEALEKEDEIKSLQESLHRSRLEAASLKFLLTKRLKMDVEGLEAGSPLWGTFPGRGRRRRRGKDDWEKRMNPMREQACATDKNRNGNKNEDEDEDEANRKPSPSCRKESSSKANDDKPTHRERRNGSGKCSSSSSSSSSSYSSFSSEGDGDPLSLKKGAEKEDVPGWSDDKETVDTEAQAQKTTRGEEPGRSAFDFNMMDGELEGYEDWSMTAEEITELQKMCVLECREAVEIRLENERLKEENDKLTNDLFLCSCQCPSAALLRCAK